MGRWRAVAVPFLLIAFPLCLELGGRWVELPVSMALAGAGLGIVTDYEQALPDRPRIARQGDEEYESFTSPDASLKLPPTLPEINATS